MHENLQHLAFCNCLHSPIPQLHEAAELLSEAADALLAGEFARARDLLRMADMPVVHAYASRIMGRIDKDLHRYRPAHGRADKPAPSKRVVQRKPSLAVERAIYQRDGYRCRFCGCRVVLGAARDAMRALVPEAIPWGRRSKDLHGAFFALTATLDHLVPHSWGGMNEADNLLTTCWPCNFGRNDALIEEMNLLDPRLRAPVLDGWDGLNRMLAREIEFSMRQRKPEKPSTPDGDGMSTAPHLRPSADAHVRQAWFNQLDRFHEGASARLLAFIKECAELGVSWKLNKILLIYVPSRNGLLSVFGIELNGSVQVPWAIGPHKQHFRMFAEAVAAAIPDAVTYETPQMWVVRKTGHSLQASQNLTIMDLLDAAPAIKSALGELHCALTG